MSFTCFGFLIFMHCTIPPSASVDQATFCQTAKPIFWAAADTRRTKEQVDEHNAKVKACRKPMK